MENVRRNWTLVLAGVGWIVLTVAAGTLSVTIGADGKITIPLAPNAGTSPAGTFYKIVFKLDGGFADILNSLHADGIQVQNKLA